VESFPTLDGFLFSRYYTILSLRKGIRKVRDLDVTKRFIDVIFAWSILILLSPLYFLISLLIWLTSGPPVIFIQTRISQEKKPFTFYKFRTMRNGENTKVHVEHFKEWAEKGGEASKEVKLKNDPRITPVGRFLRSLSIDELPQFYNVLRGDMSIVGPRPPLPYELDFYKPWYFRRLEVKPGITGLWQVSGRTRLSFQDMVRLDIEYVKKRSLALDLVIMIKTIPAILKREGAA